MDVSIGNSPEAQTSHASRGKYLGKILGNRRSECVTNAEFCHFLTSVSPKFSRVSVETLGRVQWVKPASLSEQMGSQAAGGTRKWSDQILLGVWTLTGTQRCRKTAESGWRLAQTLEPHWLPEQHLQVQEGFGGKSYSWYPRWSGGRARVLTWNFLL